MASGAVTGIPTSMPQLVVGVGHGEPAGGMQDIGVCCGTAVFGG